MGMDSILVQLQVARTGVAVEKLTREKSAEKRSRQDALQTPGSNRGWTTDYGQDIIKQIEAGAEQDAKNFSLLKFHLGVITVPSGLPLHAQ
jgi:hypothetical protein